ncbi:stage II sporulation protein M [Methanolobus sp. WCC5]|uniref:stage II sporulation protein M n=1 Tax=Methanolobus sp. WCC5 TaxID=3125785 RepID=UPI003253E19B
MINGRYINDGCKNNESLRIGLADVKWSAKVFILSVAVSFSVAIIAYILMFTFAQPEPVSEVIMNTASAATAKVTISANYMSLFWAIFIFNSIAASFAVIGTGFFNMLHRILISDIGMRPKHHLYASFSIVFEKAMMPVFRALTAITSILDRDFSTLERSREEKKGTIWQYCGYGKNEYRDFAFMLPYTVPLMIVIVNGCLMGILLAFFTFNGALTGFQLFGLKGTAIGLMYNVIYFFVAIVPHGIIEIPALLIAAAIGYRFAYLQSHDVIGKKLFNGNDIQSLQEDAGYTYTMAKDYILSGYTWKMLCCIILTLLVAAYIETYVTLEIADLVMLALDNSLETFLT